MKPRSLRWAGFVAGLAVAALALAAGLTPTTHQPYSATAFTAAMTMQHPAVTAPAPHSLTGPPALPGPVELDSHQIAVAKTTGQHIVRARFLRQLQRQRKARQEARAEAAAQLLAQQQAAARAAAATPAPTPQPATPAPVAAPAAPVASSGVYSYGALESLWESVGGPSWAAPAAATVAECESGGNPRAYNASGASGLWQILGAVVGGDLFDPTVNAENAVSKFNASGQTFAQWVCQA